MNKICRIKRNVAFTFAALRLVFRVTLYIPIGIGEFLPTSFVMNVVKLMIVLVFWGMVMSAAADPAGYFEGAFSSSSSSTRRFGGGDIQDDLDRIEQRSQHKQVMDELNSIHTDALNGRFRE